MSEDREKREQMAQVQAFIEVGVDFRRGLDARMERYADPVDGKTMGCVAREAEGSVQRTGVEAHRSLLGQVRGYAGKPPK